MKAKKVFENIEFKRGLDPNKAMDVGLESSYKIKEYWKGFEGDGYEHLSIMSSSGFDKALKRTVRNYEEEDEEPVNNDAIEKARYIGNWLLSEDGYVDSGVIEAVIMQEG